MNREILKYENLRVSFNGNEKVHGVSFCLQEGEILGIIGSSGSGKSTLIKAAMNFLPENSKTEGRILFNEKNILELSEKEMQKIRGREIGMIFQNAQSSFCPVHTLGNQIYQTLRSSSKITKQEAKEKAFNLFEKTNLRDSERIWNSFPFELSGGMAQRAAIVTSMLLEPQILLADEPTSALDTASQSLVIDQLLEIRKTFGTSIIIVSHDIDVISKIADNVIEIKQGNIWNQKAQK